MAQTLAPLLVILHLGEEEEEEEEVVVVVKFIRREQVRSVKIQTTRPNWDSSSLPSARSSSTTPSTSPSPSQDRGRRDGRRSPQPRAQSHSIFNSNKQYISRGEEEELYLRLDAPLLVKSPSQPPFTKSLRHCK